MHNFFHLAISCDDPQKIEKFYTKHFGFKRTKTFDPGPNQITILKSENIYLELFKAGEKSPVPLPKNTGQEYRGFRHISFSVDDLKQKLKEMGAAAKITYGPLELDNLIPGMKSCWIKDPEGNIIELNQGYQE